MALPAPVGEGLGVGSVIFPQAIKRKSSYRPHPLPLPLKGGEWLRTTNAIPINEFYVNIINDANKCVTSR